MTTKILYIEDEIDLGNVTKQYLELTGFDVTWFTTGKDAYKSYLSNPYDIIIIDIQLPDIDGFTLAKHISENNANACFIFLTARNLKEDKIKGLKLGAIDYITKPFDADELVLRMNNFVNRLHPKETVGNNEGTDPIQIEDVRFDQKLLSLTIGDKQTSLTLREAELFEYLYKNRNKIVKREEILLNVWGENDYFLGRSLDVFISRLRKLLSKSNGVKIENVYGVGFKLSITE